MYSSTKCSTDVPPVSHVSPRSPWALRKTAAWTDPTNQVTTSLRGCADNRSETSKCWYLRHDQFLQHRSLVHHCMHHIIAPLTSMHIYIYKFKIPCSKTFKAYPCTHHPQVWLGRQRTSSYIYDTHVKQCSTWALGFFVNGFTSGRQMHSRMDETWLSGYESWGSRDLYFGHASIILTQNEEVLTARVTLSGSNWKENPLHLIDASRSAELIFQVDVLWSCLLNFSDWFSSSIIVYHSLS